jgi:predicted MFS family arabinose efflux permease
VTLLLALFGVGATIGNLLGGRLADRSMRGTLFGGLVAGGGPAPLPAPDDATEWSAALAVVLLGTAAFVTSSPLQLMVMEKASAAPSLASSANQAAFNLANAGGAWIGGLPWRRASARRHPRWPARGWRFWASASRRSRTRWTAGPGWLGERGSPRP